MNAAAFHLMVNYLPVFGMPLATVLLGVGIYRNQLKLKQVALLTLVLIGISMILVYLSGERAADQMWIRPDISTVQLDRHMTSAMIATWIIGVISASAAMGYIAIKLSYPLYRGYWVLLFLLNILACGLLIWTAQQGKLIHHTEINSTLIEHEHALEADRETH